MSNKCHKGVCFECNKTDVLVYWFLNNGNGVLLCSDCYNVNYRIKSERYKALRSGGF